MSSHRLPPTPLRRQLIGRALLLPLSPLLALAGCASPWPEVPAGPGSSSALKQLQHSASAHGLPAWQALHDVNLALSDTWWPPGGLLGAAPGALGGSQLRLLPGLGVIAMSHAAASSRRQVLRRSGAAVQLWIGGQPSADSAARLVAAVAADLHRLLLLGPMALAGPVGPVNWAEPQTLGGRRCDHLHLAIAPGLGEAPVDRLSLYIDRDEGLLRRLRVSLSALGPGAETVLETDLEGYRRLHGVAWPTRWQTAATGALPGRPAQRWQLTGLDVDRGVSADDLARAPWTPRAAEPARSLAAG